MLGLVAGVYLAKIGHDVIVNKSTVPIGSGDWVQMLVMDGITQRSKEPVLAGARNTSVLAISKGEAVPKAGYRQRQRLL